MIEKILGLVGYRGTKRDIELKIENIIKKCDLIVEKTVFLHLEDDASIDINYVFSIDNEYDFDLFAIETREKKDNETVLYITEITEIN